MVGDKWFQKTEFYLYNYPFWKGEVLAWLGEQGLIYEDAWPPGTSRSLGGTGNGKFEPGSKTEDWAIRRADYFKQNMPQRIRDKFVAWQKVEGVLLSLNEEERKIVDCKYIQRFSHKTIYEDIFKRSKPWFNSRRKAVVERVALILGFKKEREEY